MQLTGRALSILSAEELREFLAGLQLLGCLGCSSGGVGDNGQTFKTFLNKKKAPSERESKYMPGFLMTKTEQ